MTFDGSMTSTGESFHDQADNMVRNNSFLINDEHDWSMTLANVGRLSDLARDAKEKQLTAEERLKAAEARAAEAIHWLRKLHQAVAEGLAKHGQ